ncbi:hypothetical protein AAGS61_06895 [Lysinibacillus sp. KU-BSD001]|uniref:hypothetical protein n=1 Tax=Lysinibacillus sp. KU-BSD001 TaxID=3141328 RepID=UPI0036E4F7A5
MGNFKEQLRHELRQDAPFTEEVKGRILLRKPLRKRRWHIPAVSSMFIGVIALFIFLTINRQPVTPYTVSALPSDIGELVRLLKKNETILPYMEENYNEEVITPVTSYINGYQQKFGHLPMIVERSLTYEIGDYVMLDEHGMMKVAQIVGTAGDTVTLEEGRVTVNGQPLALPNLVGKVSYEKEITGTEWHVYLSPLASINEQHVTFDKLASDEFVIVTDRTLEKWTLNHVKGKVVAIQQITPTYTLTAEEQQLYTQFKESYQLELLRDISPLTIAKIHLIAASEHDWRTNYTLLKNKKGDFTQWLEEVVGTDEGRPLFSSLETKLSNAYKYNGLENGKFSEAKYGHGYIEFTPTYNAPGQMSLHMMQNEDGIWQPTFMP